MVAAVVVSVAEAIQRVPSPIGIGAISPLGSTSPQITDDVRLYSKSNTAIQTTTDITAVRDCGIAGHLGEIAHAGARANTIGVAKDISWKWGLFIVGASIGG
jgi:hypothetical protein